MCIIPLIKFGTMGDFCWNASVPAYFLLMTYTIQYVFNHTEQHNLTLNVNKQIIGLAICFSFAFLNPFSQIAFGFKIAYQEKTFDLMCRGVIDTLSDKDAENYEMMMENFLRPAPENTAFYKYLAKIDVKSSGMKSRGD